MLISVSNTVLSIVDGGPWQIVKKSISYTSIFAIKCHGATILHTLVILVVKKSATAMADI